MGQQFDVVLISALGRSLGMACEMAQAGLRVGYIDLTYLFYAWDIADWEGPFGVFEPAPISDSQRRIDDLQALREPLSRGLTIYDQMGVIEFTSPMSEFLVRRASEDDPLWLNHLSRQLCAVEWREGNEDVAGLRPLPVHQNWHLHISTASRIAESHEVAKQLGVTLFSDPVLDISIHRGVVENLQLNKSGIIYATEFVWCLSQEDSLRLPPAVASRVYPFGVVASTGQWMRFQFEWVLGNPVMRPPASLVVLGHRELPWSHGNLLMIEDKPTLSLCQVWARLPAHSRFLRSRLESIAQQIESLIQSRWPLVSIKLKQMPLEYTRDEKELGPPRQPLFDPSKLAGRPRAAAKNWIELGPETVGSLDLNSRWLAEMQLSAQVVNRWQRLKDAKRESVEVSS